MGSGSRNYLHLGSGGSGSLHNISVATFFISSELGAGTDACNTQHLPAVSPPHALESSYVGLSYAAAPPTHHHI